MANADRCVCCGEIIQEGRMVCPNCEEGSKAKRLIETTAVRCPGLPYPDYTELDKLTEEGWRIINARCEPKDHCVYFTLERDKEALFLILHELGGISDGK